MDWWKDIARITHRWSCLLKAFPHLVHICLLSSLWVSLCFVRAEALLNNFPHVCKKSNIHKHLLLNLPWGMQYWCWYIWFLLGKAQFFDAAWLDTIATTFQGRQDEEIMARKKWLPKSSSDTRLYFVLSSYTLSSACWLTMLFQDFSLNPKG